MQDASREVVDHGNDHVKGLGLVLAKVNLDYDRYIPVHARAAPLIKADVNKA
jgi:hypothetical protein